jgi:xylulokinase
MNAAPAGRTILAIDLGTQSLRVSAITSEGRRFWSWSSPVDSDVKGECFEQSVLQWQSLLDSALEEAAHAGVRPDAIAAAGALAGYVALDADGVPMTPAIMYTDSRSLPDAGRVERALGSKAPFRTVISDPWPHWLRLCRERPDIAAKTRYFLDATGLLNFHLTGVATLNYYTALRLGPADASRLLEITATETPRFGRPTVVGETIGQLTGTAARLFGDKRIPVIAATFDSKCAYLGSGIRNEGDALDISGTVTSFGTVSNKPIDDAQRRVYSVPFGDHWLVRGSTAAAGSALEWARTELLSADFAALDAAAAGVAPGAGGLSFLPYLAGERTPLWNPNARGVLLGLALDTRQPQIVRAVYEGLAFSLAHIVRTMEQCGLPPREIRLAGGLARNDLLAQIKTDVLGVPVLRLADHELTTVGLAVIASVAIGAYCDHAAASRHFVKIERQFMPDKRTAREYGRAEARYRLYSEALGPVFRRIADDRY